MGRRQRNKLMAPALKEQIGDYDKRIHPLLDKGLEHLVEVTLRAAAAVVRAPRMTMRPRRCRGGGINRVASLDHHLGAGEGSIPAGVATWEREIMLERQREGIAKARL